MQLIAPFLMCLISIIALIFIRQVLDLSLVFFSNTASFLIFLKIFGLLVLSYLPILIPFCFLFAILFGYESLSQNSELAILSNFGYNKKQLSQPALLMAILSFFFSIYVLNTLGPSSKYLSNSLGKDLKRSAATFAITPGVFINKIPNYTIYTETKDDNLLKKILISYKGKKQTYDLYAKSGILIKDKVGLLGLKLNDGYVYSTIKKKESSSVINFKTYNINLFLKNSTQPNYKKPLVDKKTKHLLKQLKIEKSKVIKFRIKKEVAKRYLISLSTFFFFFIGSLLGIRLHARSTKGSSFLIVFGVFASFWGALFTGEYLSNSYNNIYFMLTPLIFSLLASVIVFMGFNKKEII